MRRTSLEVLDGKIAREEQAVKTAKHRYDDAAAELEKLLAKKKEMQSKELLRAFAESSRSYEEIMMFLKGEDCPPDEE